MKVGEAIVLGQADGVGKELFDVLGDPTEGVGILRRLSSGDVPLEILEVEGVDDVDAPREVCGFYTGFDATVRAGGPGGCGEFAGRVRGKTELIGNGNTTKSESLCGDVARTGPNRTRRVAKRKSRRDIHRLYVQ